MKKQKQTLDVFKSSQICVDVWQAAAAFKSDETKPQLLGHMDATFIWQRQPKKHGSHGKARQWEHNGVGLF